MRPIRLCVWRCRGLCASSPSVSSHSLCLSYCDATPPPSQPGRWAGPPACGTPPRVSRSMRRGGTKSLEGQSRARGFEAGPVIALGGCPSRGGASEARDPGPHWGQGKGPAQMASPRPSPAERFWELLCSPSFPVGPGSLVPVSASLVWASLPPHSLRAAAPMPAGRTGGTLWPPAPQPPPLAQALAPCPWAEWRRASCGLAWW